MIKRYGWVPDVPDQRDFAFEKFTRKKIDDKVDLRLLCSPIEDQGDLGSCTANAGVGIYEFLEKKQGMVFIDASRLFLYYNTRVIEGSPGTDSGASIRDTIKSMSKTGMCDEKSWPYNIKKFAVKPPPVCYTQAAKRKALVYERIETLNDMLQCLSDGFPFDFGFTVYESFESDRVAKTGIVPMPAKKENVLGGHSVVAVGYDQLKKWFIVRNSWGTGWGDRGYCYMPFAYLTDRNLSDDLWVVRKET